MAVERTSISGASVLVTCDGQDVGWATGLDGEVSIEVREVRALNDIDAKELKIVRRSVTFSLRSIRIPNLGAATLGLVPDGDSLTMVRLKPLTFNIIDEDSGAVLKRIYGCKPTSLRFQVNEGELFQENCSWRGIRVVDGDK
jgi:hypothetical protein